MVADFRANALLKFRFFSCVSHEVSNHVLAEGSVLVPETVICTSVVLYSQIKWCIWDIHCCWAVTLKLLVELNRTSCGVSEWHIASVEKLSWPCSLPVRVFVPFSASQTNISWPSWGSVWSWTSPQHSLRLSSLARKPKWIDRNHHIVFCRDSGLLSPNSPARKSASSSSSVKALVDCCLFPSPILTIFLRFAAKTFRDLSNSGSLRKLTLDFWSFKCVECRFSGYWTVCLARILHHLVFWHSWKT